MKREEKVETVERLQAELVRRPNIFLAEYRGMTVEQITELRVKVRKADGAVRVVKNTLLRRAVAGTPNAAVTDLSRGPNAVILGGADVVELTKVLMATDRDVQPFSLKGGVVGGHAVTAAEIRQLAELPPRSVLLGRMLGSLSSPARGFVSVCHGNIRKLVYALDAVRQAKEKSAA